MTHAIIAPVGAAEALVSELSELGIKAKAAAPGWAEATLSSSQLTAIHVHAQIALRVIKLTGVTTRQQVVALASTIKPEGSFAVRASGEDRQELQEEIGALIHEQSGAPVNLEKPDTLIYCHESGGEWLVGVDCFGDLSKRHYKIMNGSLSLAGPVAAAILRLAGWTPKHDLLIWPSATGELAIEAALWASKKSPRAYELSMLDAIQPDCTIIAADPALAAVRSVEKNAKVAGVNPYIRFSRQDAEWLETKHDESSIRFCMGVLQNLKLYPKLAKELFYQFEYILPVGAIAAFVCVNDESADILENHAKGFYSTKRIHVWQGKKILTIVQVKKIKATPMEKD